MSKIQRRRKFLFIDLNEKKKLEHRVLCYKYKTTHRLSMILLLFLGKDLVIYEGGKSKEEKEEKTPSRTAFSSRLFFLPFFFSMA